LVIYGNCTVVVEAPSILVYRDEEGEDPLHPSAGAGGGLLIIAVEKG